MIIICIRTFILYMVVLFSLRIMGKSELSKMSTFQMVVLFMIAELASIPIDDPASSLINGAVAILTLMFLQVLISYISIRNEHFKNFVSGRPSVIIDKGKINVKEMRRLRISVNDLFEQLRLGDCPSLSDVEYAVMESNGQLSIITTDDHERLPLLLVSDGTLYEENLKKANITRETLMQMLGSRGLDDLSNVFIAFYDGQHQFHAYPVPPKNQKYAKEVK
ncbi:MAG: YetF domain-containing protein [Emergencia sp.]